MCVGNDKNGLVDTEKTEQEKKSLNVVPLILLCLVAVVFFFLYLNQEEKNRILLEENNRLRSKNEALQGEISKINEKASVGELLSEIEEIKLNLEGKDVLSFEESKEVILDFDALFSRDTPLNLRSVFPEAGGKVFLLVKSMQDKVLEFEESVDAISIEKEKIEREIQSARGQYNHIKSQGYAKRTFFVKRRFGDHYPGVLPKIGLFEAILTSGNHEVVVLIANEEVAVPNQRVTLLVKSVGSRQLTVTHTSVYGKYETSEYFPHYQQVDFLEEKKDITEYDLEYQRKKIDRLGKMLEVVSKRTHDVYDENSKEVAAFVLEQSKEALKLLSGLEKQ